MRYTKKTVDENTVLRMAKYIARKYDCVCDFVELEDGTFLYIHNKAINLLITITSVRNDRDCIKLEEIMIEEEFRGKGLGTKVVKDLIELSKAKGVRLGLWCDRNNKRLFNYYSRLGFKYMETLDDDWLEV